MTLSQIIDSIADVIIKRSEMKKNFGVILVPEGLIEFIPEMKELISALNDIIADNEQEFNALPTLQDKKELIYSKLPCHLAELMKSLPFLISSELLIDRDPHGNVQVSQIETEKLLVSMLKTKLGALKKENKFSGKFTAITHFFGYEGRCGAPSNFDANYTYALGYNASVLALNNCTGYISSIRNLVKPPLQWECGGIPLAMMMTIERRKGKEKPVIQKALVLLDGKPFMKLVENREKWAIEDCYLFPGPIQYFGPSNITDLTTITLKYEH